MAGGRLEEVSVEEVAMVTNLARCKPCPPIFFEASFLPLVSPPPLPPFYLHLRRNRDKVMLGELSWQI